MSIIYKNITGNTEVTLLDLRYENVEFESEELESGETEISTSYGFNNLSSNYETLTTGTPIESFTSIKSINLCNVNNSDSVDVDLYYFTTIIAAKPKNDYTKPIESESLIYFYLLKNVTIPKGVTLKLNKEDDLFFNSSVYELKIKLSASDSTVDVIINK